MRMMLGLLVAGLVIACGPSPKRGDDGDDGDDSTTGPDSAPCAATAVTAMEAKRPSDIIWVIDNSGSMDEEEQRVQDNMNVFAQKIAASGIDYHVVVIADVTHINVPPPLGGGTRLQQVNINIDSHNALEKVIEAYPMYQSFLRPGALKHIVVVSDDESDWSKAMFEGQVTALPAPGFGADWRLHAVVAEDLGFGFPPGHCFTLAAAPGTIYIALQQAHMGLFYSLCDTNWDPLFVALGQAVGQGGTLPCAFALPTPPVGQSLDPSKVNFVYTPSGGQPTTIANVSSMAGCGGGQGWYYDDPAAPTQIIVCPGTCSTLEADKTGKIDVAFGCSTVIE
jgi:hypothetical protein